MDCKEFLQAIKKAKDIFANIRLTEDDMGYVRLNKTDLIRCTRKTRELYIARINSESQLIVG